jgi:undecaprenyl-diphosphatase
MESLVELDKALFLYLNNLGSPAWDGLWLFITNKLSSIPLYALILFLIYKNFGLQKTLVVLLCVALMITLTDQLANAFKDGVERLRPCGEPTLEGLGRFVARCGRYGYFSGHATSSFALATFLSLVFKGHFKFFTPLIFIWALFVSYSRIYVGIHYPGDVLTGMLVGTLIALFCYRIYVLGVKKVESRFTSRKDN